MDTSGVTTMDGMFYRASSFNQDISGIGRSRQAERQACSLTAYAFNQDLGWCVDDDVDLSGAFDNTPCESTSCGVTQVQDCACRRRGHTTRRGTQPARRQTVETTHDERQSVASRTAHPPRRRTATFLRGRPGVTDMSYLFCASSGMDGPLTARRQRRPSTRTSARGTPPGVTTMTMFRYARPLTRTSVVGRWQRRRVPGRRVLRHWAVRVDVERSLFDLQTSAGAWTTGESWSIGKLRHSSRRVALERRDLVRSERRGDIRPHLTWETGGVTDMSLFVSRSSSTRTSARGIPPASRRCTDVQISASAFDQDTSAWHLRRHDDELDVLRAPRPSTRTSAGALPAMHLNYASKVLVDVVASRLGEDARVVGYQSEDTTIRTAAVDEIKGALQRRRRGDVRPHFDLGTSRRDGLFSKSIICSKTHRPSTRTSAWDTSSVTEFRTMEAMRLLQPGPRRRWPPCAGVTSMEQGHLRTTELGREKLPEEWAFV